MKTPSPIFAVGENTNGGDLPLPVKTPIAAIRRCRCFHRQFFAVPGTQ